eukprot:COSAG02_NODE_258_length_26815_cov_12.034998_13_plen_480_part_00
MYLLLAWVAICIYQATKAWARRGNEVVDIETVFVVSSTLMLAVGISSSLFTASDTFRPLCLSLSLARSFSLALLLVARQLRFKTCRCSQGKWINDITTIGLPHVLRVKQAELLEKSTHYLVEHDFWNGTVLHRTGRAAEGSTPAETGAHSRKCVHHREHEYKIPRDNRAPLDRTASTDWQEQEQKLKDASITIVRARAAAVGVPLKAIREAMNAGDVGLEAGLEPEPEPEPEREELVSPKDPKEALIDLIKGEDDAFDQRKEELRFELQQLSPIELEDKALSEGAAQYKIDEIRDSAEVSANSAHADETEYDVGTYRREMIELIVARRNRRIAHIPYDEADCQLLEAIESKVRSENALREIDIERKFEMSPDTVVSQEQSAAPDKSIGWLSVRTNPNAYEDKAAQELQIHCYRLLETLIQTVQDEYRVGSRAHWGAEDRRTKLWFIVTGQNTIRAFAAAVLSGVSPLVLHIIDKMDFSP